MSTRTDEGSIVLLGSRAMGGIAAVIRSYRAAGLFERWRVVHIATHCDGSAWQKLLLAVGSFARFCALLARGRVRLVHVHSASNASFWRKSAFLLAAFAANRPVIFHLHGGGFLDFYRRCGRARRAFLRFVLDQSSEIVVLSDVWRRRMARMTRNPNIRVIASPVEAGELLTIERKPTVSANLVFVGRLDPNKGLHELVDALARLGRRHERLRLCLAGEGDRDTIARYAAARGVGPALSFAGWVAGERKRLVLAEADVFVLPSYIENLPMSVLEAMAAGLPVVATDVGGIPELVKDDVNGRLVAPRDVEALTAALGDVLDDPELRLRMGRAGRQLFIDSFAPARSLEQLEEVYRRCGARPRLVSPETGCAA